MNAPENQELPRDRGEQYRWVIIVAGICGLFASLGIGRFALGMLLPAMGEALRLTYSQMGIISTLNFCGYLGAVLFCGRLTALLGARTLIALALALVGGSMLVIGLNENLYLIMLLYFITGVGSALSNVPIMALVAAWFAPAVRGRASGLVVIGNGLGIIMAGNLVPRLNGSSLGWQMSWIVLGLIAILAAIVCWLLVRNRPADVVRGKNTAASSRASRPAGHQNGTLRGVDRKIFVQCAVLYFLFGFTYVIYATFFVTSLVQDRGFSEQEAGILWSWVGFLSLGSGPIFGYLSDRLGRRAGLITVFSIQAAAYGAAVGYLPQPFLYISIICFGLVAWSIPSIMAALVGDFAGPERTAAIFGFVTFIFGFGQISGPYCAGLLAEATGRFAESFLLAAGLAIVAALLSSRLPGKPGQER